MVWGFCFFQRSQTGPVLKVRYQLVGDDVCYHGLAPNRARPVAGQIEYGLQWMDDPSALG